jgi:hypothetical protein
MSHWCRWEEVLCMLIRARTCVLVLCASARHPRACLLRPLTDVNLA